MHPGAEWPMQVSKLWSSTTAATSSEPDGFDRWLKRNAPEVAIPTAPKPLATNLEPDWSRELNVSMKVERYHSNEPPDIYVT